MKTPDPMHGGREKSEPSRGKSATLEDRQSRAPKVALPKGGGAIRGIGEKFSVNAATGTASMTVPIATSPARSGFGPKLSVSYNSGGGNGAFGFGWSLSLPDITRKTDNGLPKYKDGDESDVFILSDAEDLVPALRKVGGKWTRDLFLRTVQGSEYQIQRYRPRIEGMFLRIERWTNSQTGEIHWRCISGDNITTIYGRTAQSRITDPFDAERIFSWLPCESYDDRGNAILYEYQGEDSKGIDSSQVNERNRTLSSRSAQRYLKRIKYGNRTPRQPSEDLSLRNDWLFEVVLDYDEGHYALFPIDTEGRQFVNAQRNGNQDWSVRKDAFSKCRAGFELRTYRLCRRVLLFHHFPDELFTTDYLVRSTEFAYEETPIASFLNAVTASSYRREADGRYLKKSLPPVEFEYSKAVIDYEIRAIDPESLENIPQGLDNAQYEWVDLDGEGIAGVFTESTDAWYYKPNLGEGRFGALELVARRPSIGVSGDRNHNFMDLSGDGQLDFVELGDRRAGFYERTLQFDWEAFKPLHAWPNLSSIDPNLRFVDLTGDGLADILLIEDGVFRWYPSLAEEGFGACVSVQRTDDSEKGPKLIFSDSTQSIFLADMNGDGLMDLLRIRNGEVCYWPNMGYGRFGSKVTMDESPCFDAHDLFDQGRIRLADIDGSGVSDIIYLARDGLHLYFNQAGNGWGPAFKLTEFPPIDSLSTVLVADLLGNGTACLLWSSPLPNFAQRPLQYLNLMGRQKPHLLVAMKNNLGAETHLQYAPSTQFYLADKTAGTPWATRLPFPVQVITRVDVYDRVSRNRFVSRYAYHHGYFDGHEREFRGFGMVEQTDTETLAEINSNDLFHSADNVNEITHVPPVLTRSWFHTGAYLQGGIVSRIFAEEYYCEGDASLHERGLSDTQLAVMELEDTILPQDLSAEEERQACRSLKGHILRQEIYALDGTEKEDRPYKISEKNYTIRMLQPREGNMHAVFFIHDREAIEFQYERQLYEVGGRKLADPRVGHSLVLQVDDYGNKERSVAIAYGRRHDLPDALLTPTDRQRQKRLFVTCTENQHTNAVLEDDAYRTPRPCEKRIYEILKVVPDSTKPDVTNLFRFQEILAKIESAGDGLHDLPYEDMDAVGATAGHPYRRLTEQTRTLYLKNDLSSPLPPGQLASCALPFESYALAFTPSLLSKSFGARVTPAMLLNEGKYVDLEGNGNFWIPTGRSLYSPNVTDSAPEELAFALQHFFLPHRFQDPLGFTTKVRYDAYDLLVLEFEDALQNKLTVGERDSAGHIVTRGNDYRVLHPRLVTDPNGNRSEAIYDTLGLVVGTAVKGKISEIKGDSLAGFQADLTQGEIDQFFNDPKGPIAQKLLGNATSRTIYDVSRYQRSGGARQPSFTSTITRETHLSDLSPGQVSKRQVSFTYSDGFEREIQKKMQAERGPLIEGGPDVNPRWVGNSWILFNNKGKPVRQYEPFFSSTHDFDYGKKVGVSPTLCYDPTERVVATIYPDQTYIKSVFDPWHLASWDQNDNVLQAHPDTDPDVSGFYRHLPMTDYLPSWHTQRLSGGMGPEAQAAAHKAAAHADTPTRGYFDPLGRGFLAIADNGTLGKQSTRIKMDIEGNQFEVIDSKGRVIERSEFDMLGNRVHQISMEAAERWTLHDVLGKPVRGWDSRQFARRQTYDELQRPTHFYVRENGGPEILAEYQVYGDSPNNGLTANQTLVANLRGKLYRHFDGAGVLTHTRYDFKGNLTRSTRQLVQDYKVRPNWSASPTMEAESFVSAARCDALNRTIQAITPHSNQATLVNVIQVTYNEAGLLERVSLWLRQSTEPTTLLTTTPTYQPITNVDYDAKGRYSRIIYGNGSFSEHYYDPLTFRLARLKTSRNSDGAILQDLHYTYDPGGRVTKIADDAHQPVYFNNAVVEPHAEYTYDALYRLIKAEGRELIGQVGSPQIDGHDHSRARQVHPHDGQAMRKYIQQYHYDEVGNITNLIHQATAATWNRAYIYDEASLIEPTRLSNRLTRTLDGGVIAAAEPLTYDSHGNITSMSHLAEIAWDFKDHLQTVNMGGGGKAYFVYDSSGQRIRKVWEKSAGVTEERIYLGDYELFRKRTNGALKLERETVHVLNDRKRIALVETRTHGTDASLPQLIRYQYSNHLGSSHLELNQEAQVISYEEYYAYGSTSYQAVWSQTETPKRYRYSGKERDEETGLYYYGERYHAPWLGRWISCDPPGLTESVNPYTFARNNPISYVDSDGNAPVASINGEIGEHIATQVLDEQGLYIFTNWDKHVNHKGFDFIAYDPKTKKVWFVDNKAYTGTISEATSLSPANYSTNVADARKFLEKNTGKEAQAALNAMDKGAVEKVVINAYSRGNVGFGASVFTGGVKAYDVRTGKLFASVAEWTAELRARVLMAGRRYTRPGGRILGSQRGTATVGSMVFTLLAIGATVYVISQADDKPKAIIEAGAEFMLQGLIYRLAGGAVGLIAATTLSLCSDDSKMQQECARKDIVMDFLKKHVPGAVQSDTFSQTVDPEVYQQAYDFLFNTEPIVLPPSRPVSAPGGVTGQTPAPASGAPRDNSPPPPELFKKK